MSAPIEKTIVSEKQAGSERRPPKLMQRLGDDLKMLHYSPRTAEAYLAWVRRYIAFHGMRHPKELNRSDLEAFLTYLASQRHVSASTQNQALSAILFLYRKVLGEDAKWIEPPERASGPKRLPVVLSRGEVAKVLGAMRGTSALVARLLYGSGLRLLEALTLRVKDVDFSRNEILVRNAKGQKDRHTVLPESVRTDLQKHLETVRKLHESDLAKSFGRAPLPEALAVKYPNADRSWSWQWVFPASSRYFDRTARIESRHHIHESVIQKAMKLAGETAGLTKAPTPHSLRHYSESRTMPSDIGLICAGPGITGLRHSCAGKSLGIVRLDLQIGEKGQK